jgi:hypothetical protein
LLTSVLQTRPEMLLPHSMSVRQPQVRLTRQRVPALVAVQFWVLVDVHSTQVLLAPLSQT